MDTVAVSVPSLPPGFVLDDDSQAPEPPQGFVADGGAPQEQPGATLADYGRSAMAGGAQVGRGAGWGLRQLGEAIDSEGIAGAGRGLEDVSQRAVEYWQEGMTPAARAEMGKQFVRETPEGDYELGDAGLATTGLMAAGSALPSMLGMGIGGVAAKGLGAVSGAMGAGAHPVIEGAIGYGLGEAAVSAPTAGAEVYARVMDLDVGALEQHPEYAALKEQYGDKTQEAIADAASLQAAGQSGLSTFALSAPMGAMLGKILRGVPTATTRARAVASGAAGEAGQEFAQSGAEQALSNLAVQQRADPSQRLGEGVLEAAVGGAAAGGMMGGGIGTMARLEPAQPAPVAPEPAVPEPAVPLAQPGEPFSLDTAENQGEIWTYMGPSRTNPATMAEMISPNGIITDVGLDVLVPMEQALEQETTQPTPAQAQQTAPQDAAIPAALPEGTEKGAGVVPAEEGPQQETEYAKQDTEAKKSDGRGMPQPPVEIEDTEKGGVQVQPRGPGGRKEEEIAGDLPVQREGGAVPPRARAEEEAPGEEPWAARLDFDAETIERHPDLKDPEAMAGIRHMAEGAGWSEIGGRVIRGADEQVSGRTAWAPKEAWFAEKPQGVTAQHFKGAVERLDAGRKLTKPQREALSFMVAYTQEMQADELTPTAGTNEYDSMSAFDKGLTVLALELDEIDPGAGESILESADTRDLSNAETRVEIEKALSDKRVAGVAGAEARRGEEFGLEGQTETQAGQKAAEGEQRKQAELEQERKDKADRERGEFVLSGSTASVDEAEALGQTNLFGARKKGAPAGTSPEAIQRSARRVVAKHDLLGKGVSFVVAPTSASLPKHIRAAMKTQGAEGDVQGVLDGRTVYLVANRLDSPSDVERVILHEMLGHYGARKLFGPRVVSRVSRVHKAVGGDAGIRALGRKHGFDMEPYFETANELYKNDPLGREFLLADELLAHLAQSGPKSLPVKVVRALREFIGAMRDWLARHGYRSLAKMNDADLAYLLRNMRKAAKAPAGKEVQPIRGIDEQAFSRKATGYTEGLDSLLEKTGGDMTKAGKRLHTASMHPATKQLAHGRDELHFMTWGAMGVKSDELVDGFYDPETKVFLSMKDAKRVVRATYGETIDAPSETYLESQELKRTRNADEAAGRATGIEVEELAAEDPVLAGLDLPWADATRFARVTKAPPAATKRKPGAVVGNVETTPVSPDIRYSRMRQSGRPRSGEFIITGYDDYGRPKFGKTRHESLKHKSVLRAAMDKYFTKEGNLTRETFDRKIKMEGDKSAVDVTAEFLTHAMRRAAVKSLRKPWSKIDAATKREINEQLAGRKTSLPKSVKAAIAPLRADLDARSNGLIRMKLDLIQLRMAGLDDKTRTATAAAMDDIMSGRTDYADMDMTGLDKYSISGVAMIKTIQANKGEYLNRAYQIHDDPKWEKRVRENTRVMAAAEGLIRDDVEMKDLERKEKEARAIVEKATPWKEEIKGHGTMAAKAQRRRERVDAEIENIQGLAEDEVKALVDGAISRMLLAGAKSRDLVSFLSSEQLGQKDLGILMRRKGIPEPIRRLLGEYKDPQYNYVRSASKMTHLTASHDFLMGVRRAGLGQFLSLGETKAFPAEITTFAAEEMNPLTGLYTTPEFNEAMKDAVGPKQLDGLIRTALAANSAVKYGATVLSPITAARNFYSAGFFTVMNGHFNWGHAKKSAAITLADLAKKGDTEAAKDYTVKMVELGVLHSGVRSEELWDAAQDALDMDKPQSRTSEALKTAFIKIPTKIYRAGDDFWKVIGFENERAGLMKHRGMSEAQAEKVAAERIRNGYPTYSHVPRTIQMLRRFPLMGPFVSFPWEIMRTTSHQLRFLKEDYDAGAMPLVYRRAAGMIVAGSIGQAVSLAAMAALGLDSDDDEAYRENGPRWQRNSQLFYHRDNEGKMWTLDLSHLDPYTYLKAPITALLSGRDVTPMAKLGDAMVQLLEPFLGVEITTGAIVEVLMNQRIDSGAPVYNEAASDWDKAGSALNHLRRKLQPGLARQLENLYLASQGHVSRGGKEYTLPGEAATFVGFRFTPMNPEISLKYRAYEFNDARSDASRLLSYPLSDPNKLTVGGIKDAYDSMIDARKLLYKDMIAAVKSSKTLGMTNMEVRRMLRGAGVSGKDISALIRGEVAKWRPSPQFLRRSQATLLAAVKTPSERAEVRRLFGERRREVQRLAAGAQ